MKTQQNFVALDFFVALAFLRRWRIPPRGTLGALVALRLRDF